MPTERGHRGQRQNGVTKPAGAHDDGIRRAPCPAESGIRLVYFHPSRRRVSKPARSDASTPGSSARQRRCIHNHKSGRRRTAISRTSVQRCVNSSARSSACPLAKRHDRMSVETMRNRPFGNGSAKTGITGAPVRNASAASADAVAAGPAEKFNNERVLHLRCAGRSSRRRCRSIGAHARSAHSASSIDHAVAGVARTRSSKSCKYGLSSGRAITDMGGNANGCAMPCNSQNPKWPENNKTPLPSASAVRTRSLAVVLDAALRLRSGR